MQGLGRVSGQLQAGLQGCVQYCWSFADKVEVGDACVGPCRTLLF